MCVGVVCPMFVRVNDLAVSHVVFKRNLVINDDDNRRCRMTYVANDDDKCCCCMSYVANDEDEFRCSKSYVACEDDEQLCRMSYVAIINENPAVNDDDG